VLSEDLREACLSALGISRQTCVEFAACHSWEASARAFIEHMPLIEARGVDHQSADLVPHRPGWVA